LSLADLPTVLALLILVPGLLLVFIDVMLRLNDFPTKTDRRLYGVVGGAALWIAMVEGGRRLRRKQKDRCLDVISWLFPDLPVYEVGGVHFQLFGWISAGSVPEARVMLLSQNCHRGGRILSVDVPPQYGRGYAGAVPLTFEVVLGDAGVVMSVASCPLTSVAPKECFDVKARVVVKSSGRRVRLRHGFAPETPLMQAGEVVAALQHPVHLALSLARAGTRTEAPLVLVPAPELDALPWPTSMHHPVWSPNGGWQLEGASRELLKRLSIPYGSLRAEERPPDPRARTS
jgi:hypothetical protein